MRLLKFRRADDSTDTSSVEEATEVTESSTDADQPDRADQPDHEDKPTSTRRQIQWSRVIAYGLLPVLALMLASAAGYLKWRDGTAREAQAARVESVQAAIDGTVALLSYRPDTVEKDLEAAK